jgi:hypothetical protein
MSAGSNHSTPSPLLDIVLQHDTIFFFAAAKDTAGILIFQDADETHRSHACHC